MEREQQWIKQTLESQNVMLSQYENGEISAGAYQKYLDDVFYAEQRRECVDDLVKRCKAVSALNDRGSDAYLLYETYWERYFNRKSDIFIQMIFVIALILRLSSNDEVSGMRELSRTYCYGRTRLFHAKLSSVTLCCAMISFIFSAAGALFFSFEYDLKDAGAPVVSLTGFHSFPVNISIIQFAIILSLFRAAALCLFGTFLYSVASLAKNVTAAFAATGVFVFIPFIFSLFSDVFSNISFYWMLFSTGIMNKAHSIAGIFISCLPFLILTFLAYIPTVYSQSDFRQRHLSFLIDFSGK